MPTYRNSTVADITIGSYRIPAKSDLKTGTFLEVNGLLPTGITQVSVDPQTNKTLLANKYTALTGADVATIDVPDSDSKGYIISFYVESGEFQIRFNEASMTPSIRITEGQTWTKQYVSKVVTDIRIHCVVGGNIYLNIEKL